MNFLFGGDTGKSSVLDHAQKVVAELEVTLNSKNNEILALEVLIIYTRIWILYTINIFYAPPAE